MSTEPVKPTPASTQPLPPNWKTILRALTPPADNAQGVSENAELAITTVTAVLDELVEAGLVQGVGTDDAYYELTRKGYDTIGPGSLRSRRVTSVSLNSHGAAATPRD